MVHRHDDTIAHVKLIIVKWHIVYIRTRKQVETI